jgi:hypothetical protein
MRRALVDLVLSVGAAAMARELRTELREIEEAGGELPLPPGTFPVPPGEA